MENIVQNHHPYKHCLIWRMVLEIAGLKQSRKLQKQYRKTEKRFNTYYIIGLSAYYIMNMPRTTSLKNKMRGIKDVRVKETDS